MFEAFPESRAAFEEADRALDLPLSRLCFAGSDSELALTENTQPAILATSVAALRALESRGVSAAAAAGHSLGEYTAHVAAGSIGYCEALRTVRCRGRFMQEAVAVGRGAMAAILGLDAEHVESLCRQVAANEVVAAANLNGPAQTVIAGDETAVARAVDAARRAGARRAVALAVSAPFHCKLMRPAAERLRPVLEALAIETPRVPVYTNVDARPVRDSASARDALWRQVEAPVRWQALVEAMIADGFRTFVEIGPGRVLAGLLRKIDRDVEVFSAGEPQGVLAAAGELAR